MGFKTKWNRFWTLRNTEGGFTLVELVIVIAILAILAGIAVPTYSGYIKKAREATDMQLIAAVNTAFGAACLEQGIQTSDVTEAAISVTEQKVFGISSITPTTEEQLNSITLSFNSLFAGNQNTPFLTENVLSLRWVPEDNSFVMDHETSVASRVILSNGRTFNVDPNTMAQIQASTYADMGYSEIAQIIDNLSSSNEELVGVCQTLGLGGRFAAVLQANGLIATTSDADGMSAETMANGLQMVTAKHLTDLTEEELNALAGTTIGTTIAGQDLGTFGVLRNIAGNEGGTATVAAIATQYALAEAFAQTEAAGSISLSGTRIVKTGDGLFDVKRVPYNCSSVAEFLNSEAALADPVWALNTVRGLGAYEDYTETEQYTNDLNGFAATMSLLGDNIGTVSNPGAVDIGDYFQNGIYSQDAADALTQVLGN